jgi:hypothetical protein
MKKGSEKEKRGESEGGYGRKKKERKKKVRGEKGG